MTQLKCSFCERSEVQVRRLVAGAGGGYICDECVAIAARIIADSDSPTPQRTLWQRFRRRSPGLSEIVRNRAARPRLMSCRSTARVVARSTSTRRASVQTARLRWFMRRPRPSPRRLRRRTSSCCARPLLCSKGSADQVEEMAEMLQAAGISSRVDSHPPGAPLSAGPRQKFGFQTSRLGLYVLGLYVRPEDLEEARQILEQKMAEKLEASPARVGEEFEACPGCGARIPQDAESCLECGLEFPVDPQ